MLIYTLLILPGGTTSLASSNIFITTHPARYFPYHAQPSVHDTCIHVVHGGYNIVPAVYYMWRHSTEIPIDNILSCHLHRALRHHPLTPQLPSLSHTPLCESIYHYSVQPWRQLCNILQPHWLAKSQFRKYEADCTCITECFEIFVTAAMLRLPCTSL